MKRLVMLCMAENRTIIAPAYLSQKANLELAEVLLWNG